MSMLTHIYESHISTAALAANVQRFDSGVAPARHEGTRKAARASSKPATATRAETFWRKHLESIDKLIRESYAVDKPIDLLGMKRLPRFSVT